MGFIVGLHQGSPSQGQFILPRLSSKLYRAIIITNRQQLKWATYNVFFDTPQAAPVAIGFSALPCTSGVGTHEDLSRVKTRQSSNEWANEKGKHSSPTYWLQHFMNIRFKSRRGYCSHFEQKCCLPGGCSDKSSSLKAFTNQKSRMRTEKQVQAPSVSILSPLQLVWSTEARWNSIQTKTRPEKQKRLQGLLKSQVPPLDAKRRLFTAGAKINAFRIL